MGKKIKVVGYAQRIFYNDGIEYRNFSDKLVGQQITGGNENDSEKGKENAIFTNGNFIITSNFDPKENRIFKTNNFSSYFNLNELGITDTNIEVISATLDNPTVLNTDPSQLRSYVLFGSLREFIRTTLEEIISTWPASMYVTENTINNSSGRYFGDTITDYNYNIINDVTTFTVNANQIINHYDIGFSITDLDLGEYTANDIRNFSMNYGSYTINDCMILFYEPISDNQFGDLKLTLKGNPFPDIIGNTSKEPYHIKPNEELFEGFFATLSDFETYILNRLTSPKYKATFSYLEVSFDGFKETRIKDYIWPTSDGYNLDFQTREYIQYVNSLIEMADASDEVETDLMSRFLVTTSISDFDTAPGCDGEQHVTSGAKMNKILKVYGREFDEINKYIDGISYARTISYDKKDNAPDNIVKLLARSFGWELTTSLVNSDVLSSYLKKNETANQGQSRGLSIAESEVEFWRRLILNTPWIWKSKGTRKVIEMFFKLIGAPMGLYKFNEYIYTAEKPINMVEFQEVLDALGSFRNISQLNVDSDGYPKMLPNTDGMYFQANGLWYRQTGGVDADIDITTGNNPHVGPYDGGQAYLDQFRCLIPNFTAVTLHHETVTSASTNLYLNDSAGDFNGVQHQETVVTLTDLEGNDVSECMCINSEIVPSPKPVMPESDCGCDYEVNDYVLKIHVSCDCHTPCHYDTAIPDEHNILEFTFPYGLITTDLGNWWYDDLDEAKDCCLAVGDGYQPEFDYGGSGIWECVNIQPCTIDAMIEVTPEEGTQDNGSIFIYNITGYPDWNFSYSAGTTPIGSGTISSNSLLLDNLSGGQYHFEITDTYGCILLSGATITPQPCYMGVDMVVGEACCEHDDGYLDITVSSGTPPWSYQITTGTSENPISAGTTTSSNILLENLPSDTYHLLMLDSHGCSFNNNYYLGTHNCPPSLAPVRTDACCDHPDGVLQLTPNPSYPPFTYSYSGSSGYIDTGGETSGVINITGLTADTYHVLVTDDYNCTSLLSYPIISQVCPLTGTTATTIETCVSGGTISIYDIHNTHSGVPIGDIEYSYSGSSGYVGSGETTSGVINITGLTADTYSIYFVDSFNCNNTYDIAVIDKTNIYCLDIYFKQNCKGVTGSTIHLMVSGVTEPPNYTVIVSSGVTVYYSGSTSGAYTGGTNPSSGFYNIDLPYIPEGVVFDITIIDEYGCTQTGSLTCLGGDDKSLVKTNSTGWCSF